MKNPYERNVCGMGYRGKLSDGTIPKTVDENGRALREYTHWYEMIRRCYDEKYLERKPSYRNVSVDSKCLEFAYFYEHFSEIEGYEEWKTHPELKWHLDKDIKQQGVENKIYSIETCKLVLMEENVKEMDDRCNPRAVKVFCVEYPDIIFTSMEQASEWCGGCVKRNVAGKSKSAGRHPETGERLHWKKCEE